MKNRQTPNYPALPACYVFGGGCQTVLVDKININGSMAGDEVSWARFS